MKHDSHSDSSETVQIGIFGRPKISFQSLKSLEIMLRLKLLKILNLMIYDLGRMKTWLVTASLLIAGARFVPGLDCVCFAFLRNIGIVLITGRLCDYDSDHLCHASTRCLQL